MINLVKMNMYKMLRTKALAVILGIAVALSVIIYVVLFTVETQEDVSDGASVVFSDEEMANLKAVGCEDDMIEFIAQCELSDDVLKEISDGSISDNTLTDLEKMYDKDKSFIDDTEEGIHIGISSSAATGKDATIMGYVLGDITSGITLLFLSIATALYVNADQKNGYIKNIAGQVKHKSYIYLAKVVTMAVYAFLFTAVYSISIIIMCKLFGGDIEFLNDSGMEMAGKLVIAYLISIAYISGVAMLTSIMRSGTFAMVTGILFTMGFEILVFGNIDNLLNTHIFDYAPVNILNGLGAITENKEYIKAIIVGAVLFVCYNTIGTCIIEKRDAV